MESAAPRLVAGDLLHHFKVRTTEGETFAYSSIWQARNLVLAALPDVDAGRAYADALHSHATAFEARNAVLVTTTESVNALPAPGVVVADRWGEAVHVVTASAVDALPTIESLVEWLDYLEQRCPECEGESR